MGMLITNGFSLNMVAGDCNRVSFHRLTVEQTKEFLRRGELTSAIGHADTACLVSNLLGLEIPCNRTTVALKDGDVFIVAQYKGPRLPEGATTLPEGAVIEFHLAYIGEREIFIYEAELYDDQGMPWSRWDYEFN